jgi:predicted Fe-Mo cluster-binding NifX family protein
MRIDKMKLTFTVAVSSNDEKLVNQHFGHATQFRIYHYENKNVEFIEKRAVKNYCSGSSQCGDAKDTLKQILKTVEDCDIILTQRIGDTPRKILEARGKKVVQTYGLIEEEIFKVAESFA